MILILCNNLNSFMIIRHCILTINTFQQDENKSTKGLAELYAVCTV
jgi:hypothetical protein